MYKQKHSLQLQDGEDLGSDSIPADEPAELDPELERKRKKRRILVLPKWSKCSEAIDESADDSDIPIPAIPASLSATTSTADPRDDGDETPYYQSNFELVIRSVIDAHSHLFDKDEILILEKVAGLSGADSDSGLSLKARRLYIRLAQRKGPVFRINQLKYDEIDSDINAVVKVLVDHGLAAWARLEKKDECLSVLSTLTVSECKGIWKDLAPKMMHAIDRMSKGSTSKLQLKQKSKGKGKKARPWTPKLKADYLGVLEISLFPETTVSTLNEDDSDSDFVGIGIGSSERATVDVDVDTSASECSLYLKKMIGECVEMRHLSVVGRALSLFFLSDSFFFSPGQTSGEAISRTMTTLVLSNMQKTKYPTYTVNKLMPVFDSRQDIVEYEAALNAEGVFQELMMHAMESLKNKNKNKNKNKSKNRRMDCSEGEGEGESGSGTGLSIWTDIPDPVAIACLSESEWKLKSVIDLDLVISLDKPLSSPQTSDNSITNEALNVFCRALSRVVMVVACRLQNWWSDSDQHRNTDYWSQNPKARGYLARYHALYSYTRMCVRGVELLERLHRFHESVWVLKLLLGWWSSVSLRDVFMPGDLPSFNRISDTSGHAYIAGLEQVIPSGVADAPPSLIQPWCAAYRARLWERLCVDLEHLGWKHECLEACEAALSDPSVPPLCAERRSIEKRTLKLSVPPTRWKKPSFPSLTPLDASRHVTIKGRMLMSESSSTPASGKKSVFELPESQPESTKDDDELEEPTVKRVTVEELALHHYASAQEYKGVHCEGSVFRTLFGVLMWDVIFEDVAGVFYTPYQAAPMDLYTPFFAKTRKTSLENRLNAIKHTEDIGGMVKVSYSEHYGVLCQGVQWDAFSLRDLTDIAVCIGGKRLAAIFWIFSQDFKEWGSGLPDLLLWDERAPTRCKVVEVKGPRDRLSDRQANWLEILLAIGVDVEVCHVEEL